jgi:putative membrane protein
MHTVSLVLAGLVALAHLGFMALEMYVWDKPLGLKIFRMDQAKAAATSSLAKNQGLYNGFLAAGLIWGLVAEPAIGLQVRTFFLVCVIVAGIVGAITANVRIFFVQSVPAVLALVATWLAP